MIAATEITKAQRKSMQDLYATGLYSMAEIAEQFECDRKLVNRVCAEIVPVPQPKRKAEVLLPLPADRPELPVLYLSDVHNGWWPGVSPKCAHCGGRLRVEGDEAKCWNCDRVAYAVQDEPAPSARERFLAAIAHEPLRRPGRPPRRPIDPNFCRNGHPRTPENTYHGYRGWKVCKPCRRAFHQARAAEVRAFPHSLDARIEDGRREP